MHDQGPNFRKDSDVHTEEGHCGGCLLALCYRQCLSDTEGLSLVGTSLSEAAGGLGAGTGPGLASDCGPCQ